MDFFILSIRSSIISISSIGFITFLSIHILFNSTSESSNSSFLVPDREMLHLGTMIGKVWMIDGVAVAPPPSGYVHAMSVRDPDMDAMPGEECYFLEEEAEIIQDKGVKEPKEPEYDLSWLWPELKRYRKRWGRPGPPHRPPGACHTGGAYRP